MYTNYFHLKCLNFFDVFIQTLGVPSILITQAVSIDEIKCTLLHKISYFIRARVVKHAQNLLFINVVCAIYFSVSSKNVAFRIMFRKFRHFFVNNVHKTWHMAKRAPVRYLQISTRNMPQTDKEFHIYQVVRAYNYLIRRTSSPSILPFR